MCSVDYKYITLILLLVALPKLSAIEKILDMRIMCWLKSDGLCLKIMFVVTKRSKFKIAIKKNVLQNERNNLK